MADAWSRTPRRYQIDGEYETETAVTGIPAGDPIIAYWTDEELRFAHSEGGPQSVGEFTWELLAEKLDSNGDVEATFPYFTRVVNYLNEYDSLRQNRFYSEDGETWFLVASDVEPPDQIIFQLYLLREDYRVSRGPYRIRFDGQIVGEVDIRWIELRDFGNRCPQDALEETITIYGDFISRPSPDEFCFFPAGWVPDSSIEWEFDVRGPTTFTGTSPILTGAPDSTGKVAELEQVWDVPDPSVGDDYDHLISPARFIAETPDSTGNYYDGLGGSIILFHRACACPAYRPEGLTSIPLVGVALGFLSGVILRFMNFDRCKKPTSLGFGWSSPGSARVTEIGGDLVYRDESGVVRRWTLDNGEYIPLRDDKAMTIEKEPASSDARYKVISRDQTVREFQADGKIRRDIDRNGNYLLYSYTGGSLSSISDSRGYNVDFDYGTRTDGQPVSITSGFSAARKWDLEYYSSSHPEHPDRLFRVTSPEQIVTEFEYDPSGQLIKETTIRPTMGNSVINYVHDNARLTSVTINDSLKVLHDQEPTSGQGYVITGVPLVNGEPVFEDSRNSYFSDDSLGRVVLREDNYEPY